MATGEKQHLMTDGLVIREYPTIAETDRFIAILTRDKGIVRASARGARNVKSRLNAATQLLSYSRLSLIPGRDKYIIEDARPQEVFFSLREDMDKLALAQYFCELAMHMAPTAAPAEDHLRLLLNGLHYLAQGSRDPKLIKAVVEGRLLVLEGYTPDLSGCCRCAKPNGEIMWFSPLDGTLFCDTCSHTPDSVPMSAAVLSAWRHVMMGDFERCFAFSLPPSDLAEFSKQMEHFLLAQEQHRYATLDFYHSIHPELS